MKKWILLMASLVLILSFQNCQKAPRDSVSSASSTSAGVVAKGRDYNKTSAAGVSVLQLWDVDHARTLDLDLATGRMQVRLNDEASRGEDLCVTESERQEVRSLLDAAEICEPVVAADEFRDQVCVQLYKYPYAVLVNQGQEIRLGEKTDGCQIPTDLCGGSAQALKDFVQKVTSTLDQRICH